MEPNNVCIIFEYWKEIANFTDTIIGNTEL